MRSTRGFTLFEALIALVLSTVVIGGTLLFFTAIARASIPREVNGLKVAPSLGVLRDAIFVNQTFAQRVGESKAVYVFGGLHRGIAAVSVEANVRPLDRVDLPVITNFTAGLPTSAYAFYQAYQAQLGAQAADPVNTADYTVLVIGPSPAPSGALAVTCMLQVRRTEFDGDGETWSKYETVLTDTGSSSYQFAIPLTNDPPGGRSVGALHTWHRYQSGVVAEEGPTVVALPDPHLLSGRSGVKILSYDSQGQQRTDDEGNPVGEAESLPVSRFLYSLQ